MTIYLLKSKIHRAAVTDGNVAYEGSITVSVDLVDAVGMLPYEKVLIGNMANGARFETYLIAGQRGKGEIVLNGGTAHHGKKGDLITIMSFGGFSPEEASSHE